MGSCDKLHCLEFWFMYGRILLCKLNHCLSVLIVHTFYWICAKMSWDGDRAGSQETAEIPVIIFKSQKKNDEHKRWRGKFSVQGAYGLLILVYRCGQCSYTCEFFLKYRNFLIIFFRIASLQSSHSSLWQMHVIFSIFTPASEILNYKV